jgi:hypothetical protein
MPPQLTRDQVELLRADNVVSAVTQAWRRSGSRRRRRRRRALVPVALSQGGQFADITPQGFISHRSTG